MKEKEVKVENNLALFEERMAEILSGKRDFNKPRRSFAPVARSNPNNAFKK